jgi:hypothetical protein
MERAGAHLHVIGLQNDTTLLCPKILERQDQTLEGILRVHVGGARGHVSGPANLRDKPLV